MDQKKKVLIVDDEVDFVKLTTRAVQSAGYETEAAYSGKEAIGAYISSLEKGEPVSAIILDIKLPDINGLEVLQTIRREEEYRGLPEDRFVPVIMLTAYDKPWMDPLLIKGSNEYMVKSASEEDLLEKIRRVVR